MELRHLRYFIAVGRELHFGRAAAQLRIAQPAVTRQIQDLEEELGFQLFVRAGRRVFLTDSGESFLAGAEGIVRQLELSIARSRAVARGEFGKLRVGFNENASWDGPMSQALLRFRENYSNVQLDVLPMSSVEQLKAIEREDIDAGFVYNLSPGDDRLGRLLVESNPIALALHKRHPLARRRKQLRLADFQNESFVCVSRDVAPVYHDRIMQACANSGLHPRIVQEVGAENLVLALVETGGVVGLVLATGSRRRLASNVHLLELPDLKVGFDLEFVWKRNSSAKIIGSFIETLSLILTS